MLPSAAIPDLQALVRLAGDIYMTKAEWTHYYEAADAHGICYGILETDATFDIIFRGSRTLDDWWRDFKALPCDNPRLGGVESGFNEGLYDVFKDVLPALQKTQKRKRVGGHSLGGDRALLFAAEMLVAGVAPDFVAAFEPAKPGYRKLADILSSVPDLYTTRNGFDPVPEAPLTLPGFPYEMPRAPITLRAAPPGVMWPDPFAWHAISLCQKAVLALAPAAS